MSIALRPYQTTALDSIRAAMRRHRRVLLQSPTGSGKTILFAWLARQVAARGKRVCVLTHRRELLRQTIEKLGMIGIEPGVIAASSRQVTRAPVIAASVQTLARRLEHYEDAFDLIVVDEAHHAVAGTWASVLGAYPSAYVLGVTATPSRLDGRGLGDCFGELVTGPSVRDLIAQGYLADYVAFVPPGGGPDLSGIKTVMGDYDIRALADAMESRKLVGDAVEHYRRHADGRPAVAFCVNVARAEQAAEMFRAAGYRAASVDGKMAGSERDRIISGLETGAVQVVTSCELISEGLDIPAVSAAILLRPTKSLGMFIQQVGRALRPKDDGSRAVILDHAGNIAVHGLPDADREWPLTSPRRKRGKSSCRVRQCLECYAVCPVGCRACPQCGAAFLAADRGEVETLDGELIQVDRRFYGEDGRPTVERTKTDIAAALDRCATWADLETLRKALNFKPGWSRHIAASRGWRPVQNKAGFPIFYIPTKRSAQAEAA